MESQTCIPSPSPSPSRSPLPLPLPPLLLPNLLLPCLPSPSGALHPSIRNLILGLLLFFATLVLETVNYRATLRSGRTLPLVDTAAEITSWLAQLVVSLELLGIAWAWSVDDMLSPSTKRRQKRSLLLRLVGLLVVLHVAFIILGRQYDGAHYKYHESETVRQTGTSKSQSIAVSMWEGIRYMHV